MQVIGEKIVVDLIIEKQSAGGLLLPEKRDDAPIKGKIVAIGNVIPENTGCKDLKVNDEIIWYPHAGTWVDMDIDGNSTGGLLIIRPNDVIAKLEKRSINVIN